MISCLVYMALADPNPDWTRLVDPKRMRAAVEKLSSFNTRNTNSPMLAEAAEWVASEYRKIPGLQVELMRFTVAKSARVPVEREVVQVVATLPGKTDRRIIVGGHLDTYNAKADALTGRAPGANDDATGVVVALEMARIMGRRKWENTLVFVAFTGEEQGLLGAKALAKRATDEGWKIDAVLNHDTVGSTQGWPIRADRAKIRVFSDEYVGGEAQPHNSRELARFVAWASRGVRGFGVKLVFRKDRFGRGGDHTPFVAEGFDAIRFTEAYEDYARQHTPDDMPDKVDWTYVGNVARVNILAMVALASAGPAPTDVKIDLKQGYDPTVTWRAQPGVRYRVFWRETTSPVWQGSCDVPEGLPQSDSATGSPASFTVKGVNKDDHVFAVGAVGGVPVVAR